MDRRGGVSPGASVAQRFLFRSPSPDRIHKHVRTFLNRSPVRPCFNHPTFWITCFPGCGQSQIIAPSMPHAKGLHRKKTVTHLGFKCCIKRHLRHSSIPGFLRFLLFSILAIALLLPATARAYIESPYGATFQSIRMPHLPRGDEPWVRGDWQMVLAANWMNVWSIQSDRFILDGEEISLNAGLAYGLSDRIRIGLVAPYIVQGGGVLDSSIERFHSSIGVTQGQRDQFPRNRLNVSFEPLGAYYPLLMRLERMIEDRYLPRKYPRSPFDPPLDLEVTPETLYLSGIKPQWIPEDSLSSSNRSGPGDVRFYIDYQFPLTVGDGFFSVRSVVASLQASLEGSSSLIAGDTGRTASLSFLLRSERKPHSYYWLMGFSYSAFEDREFRLLELPAQQWTFRPRLGYQMEDTEFFLEYVFFSQPVKDFGRLSADGHQLGIGFSTSAGAYRVEFALIENFLTYSTTPDVGLYLALRRNL
ncbi:MAG: hypothetical protein CMF59_04335 [Leptospiraceae bacterium]|nr:hypothetical protein [Leptospiraceae bacterium]